MLHTATSHTGFPSPGCGTVQLTRSEIGKRILDGQHLIIYNNKVVRIPSSWLDVHPGGSLALLREVAGLASSLSQQVKMMAQVASVEAREAVDKKIAQREDAAFARRRVVNSLKET